MDDNSHGLPEEVKLEACVQVQLDCFVQMRLLVVFPFQERKPRSTRLFWNNTLDFAESTLDGVFKRSSLHLAVQQAQKVQIRQSLDAGRIA